MVHIYKIAFAMMAMLALTGCGTDKEEEIQGQAYNCEDIGSPCIGGTTGNEGTIQACVHVADKCCCQTSADRIEPISEKEEASDQTFERER